MPWQRLPSRPSARRCVPQVVKAEWGQPLDPEAFRAALEADTAKAIKAVILTHSETSTGVINDLETIAKHVKAHGTALTIADCVTSLVPAACRWMPGAST